MAYLMAAGGLFWIAILVGAGFLVYALLRGLGTGGPGTLRTGGSSGASPDPLAIAAARYARGEIGREEYLQLRQDLAGAPTSGTATPGTGEQP